MASAVVVEGEKGSGGLRRTLTALAILVDVVAKMNHKVVLVLAGGVAIGVEIAVGFETTLVLWHGGRFATQGGRSYRNCCKRRRQS